MLLMKSSLSNSFIHCNGKTNKQTNIAFIKIPANPFLGCSSLSSLL